MYRDHDISTVNPHQSTRHILTSPDSVSPMLSPSQLTPRAVSTSRSGSTSRIADLPPEDVTPEAELALETEVFLSSADRGNNFNATPLGRLSSFVSAEDCQKRYWDIGIAR